MKPKVSAALRFTSSAIDDIINYNITFRVLHIYVLESHDPSLLDETAE
jgi:hypothetical protein